MPKKPIKKKCDNDKFYTKPEVAEMCVGFLRNTLGIESYYVIEPSAGGGSFSSLLDCLAMDLVPEKEDIIQKDFFEWNSKGLPDKLLLLGNPPFGSANSLSKAFISHGIKEGVSTIAFVLPNTFRKYTTQKVFPSDWKLIGEMELPSQSFTLQGRDYHVPCVFQVWSCVEDGDDLREIKGREYTNDFSFVRKNANPDLFIFGAAPSKILRPEDVSKNNRGYYLTVTGDLDTFKGKAKNIDWKQFGNSSVNGGVSWFTKTEIVKVWEEYYGS